MFVACYLLLAIKEKNVISIISKAPVLRRATVIPRILCKQGNGKVAGKSALFPLDTLQPKRAHTVTSQKMLYLCTRQTQVDSSAQCSVHRYTNRM